MARPGGTPRHAEPARAPVRASITRAHRHTRRLAPLAAALLGALLLVAGTASAAADPRTAYGKQTTWSVDGLPQIGAMAPTIQAVLDQNHATFPGLDKSTVDGFHAGATYPYLIYARDTATILPMARFYYGTPTLRSTVEEILRQQFDDGSLPGIIAPDFSTDKATTTSDEEPSVVLAAATAYHVQPDPKWLESALHGRPLIDRLNDAMHWLLTVRFDPDLGLIKRGYTTDWGDVKWDAGTDNPVHMQPGDPWAATIYDQAIGYAALRELANLNRAAGKAAQAQEWDSRADQLKAATDAALWQDAPDRGFYRLLVQIPPDAVPHPYDESSIVAIGNAAALYYGLAGADKAPRILTALEAARLAAGSAEPGLSLYPPYPDWNFVQMGPGSYQNGGQWDWWAGRQVSAEYADGYSQLATAHLLSVASDWATHPGVVYEWQSIDHQLAGDPEYSGSAATMGQAVVQGLFGVNIDADMVRLQPRLGQIGGSVRVYEPATDLYVAYRWDWSHNQATLAYGTNTTKALTVRLPVFRTGHTQLYLDSLGDALPMDFATVGQDSYAEVIVPPGQHTVIAQREPLSGLILP